jgi:hypothetical protein
MKVGSFSSLCEKLPRIIQLIFSAYHDFGQTLIDFLPLQISYICFFKYNKGF